MVLPAAPLSRGTATTLSDHVETTLPVLVATDSAVAGDVTATGVLTVDNDAAADWSGLIVGVEDSTAYDITASSAALWYEAESRAPLGGATAVAGPAGASGAGSTSSARRR